jgi:ABC-2 type transport system ATP-binding protein
MQTVIHVAGLHKAYGDFEAVRGIDFDVSEGEVFGLLGPNGAGKTTTVEILEGLRPRTQGDVKVLGFDPEISKRSLKDHIGVCLQATNLPDKLKVHEALEWFAAFYSQRADCNKLLQRAAWEKRDEFYSKLSEARSSVALALALVNDPNLVFLMSRPRASIPRCVWKSIR